MRGVLIRGGALLGGILLATAGCSAGEGDAMTSSGGSREDLAVAEGSLSSSNRLSMNRLKASSLGVVDLSTAPLSANGLTLAPTSLLSTKDGRDVLTYLIRCALPAGEKLDGTWNGKVYSYSGLVGVAPEWLAEPLSPSGRRWMSACLLAHVNAYGEEVHISLRGAHPALTTSLVEAAEYSIEEMSFYGDIFTPGGEAMFACAGKGLQVAHPEDPDEYQAKRSCEEDEPCAITIAGPCYDLTPSAMDACEGGSGDWYTGCHASATKRGTAWSDGDEPFAEVITVSLHPDDFEDFYGSGGLIEIEIGLGLGL